MLELLITMAILSIILSVSIPNFSDFRETQRLIGAAEQIYGHIQQARSEAISRNIAGYVNFSANDTTNWVYGVSTVSSLCDLTVTVPTTTNACVIVMDDGDGVVDPGDGSVDSADLVLMRFSSADYPGVSMSISNFSSGNTQITFDPVRGTATSGQMDFQIQNGNQLRIKTSQLGRTSLCSPNGSAGKYSSTGC